MAKLAAVLLCVGCFLLTVAGSDDFDLSDALDTVTKRPAPPTKKPPVGNNPRPNLYPDRRPQPGGHGNDGNFNDLDLNEGNPLPPAGEREHISDQGANTVDPSTTAQITSPVVAVVVLLTVGTIAGYSAYKQKRYCFKPRAAPVV